MTLKASVAFFFENLFAVKYDTRVSGFVVETPRIVSIIKGDAVGSYVDNTVIGNFEVCK